MRTQPEPSYWPDVAEDIDRPEETLADALGVNPDTARRVMRHTEEEVKRSQALILGRVIGLLLESSNLPVMVRAIAFAAGLDQLNGAKSQAEVARELGVTRATISHYVVGVRDVLSGKASAFDITKFRKSNKSREVFKQRATDSFTQAKAAAIQKIRTQTCNSYSQTQPTTTISISAQS